MQICGHCATEHEVDSRWEPFVSVRNGQVTLLVQNAFGTEGMGRKGYSPLSHPRLVGRKGYSPLSHNKQEEAAIGDDLCHILVPPGGLAALPAATLDGSAPDGAPPGMRLKGACRPPGFESPRGVNKQEEAAIADDLCHILVPPGGLEPSTFRSGGERSNPLSYRGLCADEYSPKQPTRLKKPSAPQVVYLQHINYEQVIARDKAVLPCSHQQFADSPARRRKEATSCL